MSFNHFWFISVEHFFFLASAISDNTLQITYCTPKSQIFWENFLARYRPHLLYHFPYTPLELPLYEVSLWLDKRARLHSVWCDGVSEYNLKVIKIFPQTFSGWTFFKLFLGVTVTFSSAYLPLESDFVSTSSMNTFAVYLKMNHSWRPRIFATCEFIISSLLILFASSIRRCQAWFWFPLVTIWSFSS